MGVYASTSIMNAAIVGAKAGLTSGAPLTIELRPEDRAHGRGELVIFTDDHHLSHKLADAINRVIAEHGSITHLEAAE